MTKNTEQHFKKILVDLTNKMHLEFIEACKKAGLHCCGATPKIKISRDPVLFNDKVSMTIELSAKAEVALGEQQWPFESIPCSQTLRRKNEIQGS